MRRGHASPPSAYRHQTFDLEDFQSQLWDLCNEDYSVKQMQSLLSDTRKLKMSSEDRTCFNICGLIAPFMDSAKALTDSLGNIKQSQLWDLCKEDDSVTQMQSLLSDTRKLKMSSEDWTCINICGLIAPFMVSAKARTDSLGNIKQSIDENRKNLQLLAFTNGKLEQYTRQDNLRIFKFLLVKMGNFV